MTLREPIIAMLELRRQTPEAARPKTWRIRPAAARDGFFIEQLGSATELEVPEQHLVEVENMDEVDLIEYLVGCVGTRGRNN